MAYNKATAEKEWLRWKEAEEKKLRELGVDEEDVYKRQQLQCCGLFSAVCQCDDHRGNL